MDQPRLMSVDPSLTCSGWALFSISGKRLLGVGKIKSLPAAHSMADRLNDLQEKIGKILEEVQLSSNDVLICEAQTTMRDPRAAFSVEQVRGIFETIARERGVRVPGRVNPRSVQYEIMGLKGKQCKREVVKHTAVEITKTIYGSELRQLGIDTDNGALSRHQDIIDAILVGTLGLSWVQAAQNTGAALEEFFSQNRRTPKRGFR